MKTFFILFIFFILGIISVLRYQSYMQDVPENIDYIEKIKITATGAHKDWEIISSKTVYWVSTVLNYISEGSNKAHNKLDNWSETNKTSDSIEIFR